MHTIFINYLDDIPLDNYNPIFKSIGTYIEHM